MRRDSHMMQKGRGRIYFCHGRCFRAQFALQGAHASPSLLAHAAGRSRGPAKNAPRGFLPSHGLPPTMAAFRRKAAQLQIQLRGKPRSPTGFLLSPPPRSAAAQGTMIRCMLWLYVNSWGRDKTQIIGLCRRETLRHDFYV